MTMLTVFVKHGILRWLLRSYIEYTKNKYNASLLLKILINFFYDFIWFFVWELGEREKQRRKQNEIGYKKI